MQRFRYLTRMGNIVTSSDVDLILNEDNCLLIVNRGSMINPKPVFARREQGFIIEKEQPVKVSDLPNLIYDFNYLPTYYIGFSKLSISRIQKNKKQLEANRINNRSSEEVIFDDFVRDLKRKREKWLLKQANVDKVKGEFLDNIKKNNLVYLDKEKKQDINDVIDNSFMDFEHKEQEKMLDEFNFMPVKKVKK